MSVVFSSRNTGKSEPDAIRVDLLKDAASPERGAVVETGSARGKERIGVDCGFTQRVTACP